MCFEDLKGTMFRHLLEVEHQQGPRKLLNQKTNKGEDCERRQGEGDTSKDNLRHSRSAQREVLNTRSQEKQTSWYFTGLECNPPVRSLYHTAPFLLFKIDAQPLGGDFLTPIQSIMIITLLPNFSCYLPQTFWTSLSLSLYIPKKKKKLTAKAWRHLQHVNHQ